MREGDVVEMTEIGSDGELRMWAAEYPVPGPTDGLWSQWGQGVVGADGQHYSGVGDHLGADGNSYLFRYNPSSRRLERFSDVLSLVDHQPGAWGYGKIHAQMVADQCGSVWAFTYWGTRRDLEYGNGYEGDLLIEIDTLEQTIMTHGAVAGRRGVPSMIGVDGGRYLVGEAVDPASNDGDLLLFDTATGEVVRHVDDPRHIGFRALARDADDKVLYSVGSGELGAIDASTGEIDEVDSTLPTEGEGDFLRASTPPSPSGTFFGVTKDSETIFAMDRDGSVETLGPSDGYTASLAMSEDGTSIYWLPGAHGDAWEDGAAIRVMDTTTGEVEAVVELREPFEEHLGLLPGGTYSIVYDEGRLILGVNASPLDDDSGFGTAVLVVIEGV